MSAIGMNESLREALEIPLPSNGESDDIRWKYGPFEWCPTRPMTWAQYRQNRNIFALAYRGEDLPGPLDVAADPAITERLERAWLVWGMMQSRASPVQLHSWIRFAVETVTGDHTLVIYSNRAVSPELPPRSEPRICLDGHYGLHEPGWLPQWHDASRWHMAFVPLYQAHDIHYPEADDIAWYFRVHSDPHCDAAWYRLDWDHCIQLGTDVWRLGRTVCLAVQKAAEVTYQNFIQTWVIRRRLFSAHWDACFPRHATSKIWRLVQYLCSESGSHTQLLDALAEFQRCILEIRGWILYCLALGPELRSLDDVEPGNTESISAWLMDGRIGLQRGVFTDDPTVATRYACLQVPVWLVLQDATCGIGPRRLDSLRPCALVTHNQSAYAISPAGWSYVQLSLRESCPVQIDTFSALPLSSSASGPQYSLDGDMGHVIEAPTLDIDARAVTAEPEDEVRPRKIRRLLGKAQRRNAGIAYSDPNLDRPLLTPEDLLSLPAWFPTCLGEAHAASLLVNTTQERQTAVQAAETFAVPCASFNSAHFIPPFSLIITLAKRTDNAAKVVLWRHIRTWLQIRSYRLQQLMSASLAATTTFNAKDWRNILKRSVVDAQAAPIIQRLGMPVSEELAMSSVKRFEKLLDAASPHLQFDGNTIPVFSEDTWLGDDAIRFISWELSELDFRCELLALDILIHQCHDGLQTRTDDSVTQRYQLATLCWGGGSLRPDNQGNLLCAQDDTRLDALVAFAEFMRPWPRAGEFLGPWKVFENPDMWLEPPRMGSEEFKMLESSVWACYTQTYFDYRHRRAPVPFLRPSSPFHSNF